MTQPMDDLLNTAIALSDNLQRTLEADTRRMEQAAKPMDDLLKPCNKACAPGYCYCEDRKPMGELLPTPLPCPVCGANDGLTMTDGSAMRWGIAYCNGCGATTGEVRRAYPDDGKWYGDAIRQWNQRASLDRLAKEKL